LPLSLFGLSPSQVPPMNALLRYCSFAFALCFTSIAAACEAPCETCGPRPCIVEEPQPSWIFMHSTYSHDPMTGARVAQYERIRPVEPLEDERNVTSSYRRTQTNLRGADGSTDTYYQVQAWNNDRGGIDAQWERFHDAWKESYLQGSYYNQSPGGFMPWTNGNRFNRNRFNGNGFNGSGFWNGNPNNGFPGGGWGGPGNGGPSGGPNGPWQNNGGPGWNGGGGWNDGP
jgi:hypothetical protein